MAVSTLRGGHTHRRTQNKTNENHQTQLSLKDAYFS